MKDNRFFILSLAVILLISCSESKTGPRLLADSSGRINTVTVVMPMNDWNGSLGQSVREELEKEYEGLPLVEPQFTVNHMPPKLFDGFAKHSRNILLFIQDSFPKVNLYQDLYAKPQVFSEIRGEDADIQAFLYKENAQLISATMVENERKEKQRRIRKSLAKGTAFQNHLGLQFTYPSAYKTFKIDSQFVWIQKEIPKGHLNLIAYPVKGRLSDIAKGNSIQRLRDSIGKKLIPGRLPGSYMATEEEYRPYFYKSKLGDREVYITKGVWSVANDYMAGPYVHYFIKDPEKNQWTAVEGFTFAPSINKREYMVELETIIRSIQWK